MSPSRERPAGKGNITNRLRAVFLFLSREGFFNMTKSILDLNIKTKCEQGFEFEYIDEHENQTGVFLTVIGGASDKIRKASFAAFDRDARKAAMDKKRGRDLEIKPLEDTVEENMAITAMRVISWRGISEPCTPENVLILLQSNDILMRQVIEKSENVANFTKSKLGSSSSSQSTNLS